MNNPQKYGYKIHILRKTNQEDLGILKKKICELPVVDLEGCLVGLEMEKDVLLFLAC